MDILKGHLTNLKVLRIGNVLRGYAICDVDELDEYVNDPRNASVYNKFVGMIELVLQNRERLVELHVNDLYLWIIRPGAAPSTSIVSHHFPLLKRLSIRAHEGQVEHLIHFLQRHLSNLEELDLVILHTVSNDLLRVIQEKSGNLKKLRIKTKTFREAEVGSWNFLKKLPFLQDFQLELIPTKSYYQIVDSPSVILSCLPKSVEKISFTCLVPEKPQEEDANEGGINSNQPVSPLASEDFQNINKEQLTHLSLVNMPGAVDDSTMEFIIKGFKNLQHLDLWNSCQEVTDYGMTGVKKRTKMTSSTFSLKDLKCLEYLAFNSQKVTNKTFLHAIQFRELKYLKIQFQFSGLSNEHLTSSVIPEMLRNNGSLVTFETPGVHNQHVYYPNKQERLKWNPRILLYMTDPNYQSPLDDDLSVHSESSDSDSEEEAIAID